MSWGKSERKGRRESGVGPVEPNRLPVGHAPCAGVRWTREPHRRVAQLRVAIEGELRAKGSIFVRSDEGEEERFVFLVCLRRGSDDEREEDDGKGKGGRGGDPHFEDDLRACWRNYLESSRFACSMEE